MDLKDVGQRIFKRHALLILLFVALGALGYLWFHPTVRVRFAPSQRLATSSATNAFSYGSVPPSPGVPPYGETPEDSPPNPNSPSS